MPIASWSLFSGGRPAMKTENYAFALVMELLVSVGDRNRCRARRRPEHHGVPHDDLILVMSSRLAARAASRS
jgi:hypothetical protein